MVRHDSARRGSKCLALHSFEDVGGNTCGCKGVSRACKMLTSGLSAPKALEE